MSVSSTVVVIAVNIRASKPSLLLGRGGFFVFIMLIWLSCHGDPSVQGTVQCMNVMRSAA